MQMPWEISERSYAKRDLSNGRGGKLRRWIGKICPYCERQMHRANGYQSPLSPSRDHRIPISRGGMNMAENIVVCCRGCNESKGSLDEEEFAAWKDGLACRLDHGWWDKMRLRFPHLPRLPYTHYAKQRMDMTYRQRQAIECEPLVVAVLDKFPGAKITRVTNQQSTISRPGT